MYKYLGRVAAMKPSKLPTKCLPQATDRPGSQPRATVIGFILRLIKSNCLVRLISVPSLVLNGCLVALQSAVVSLTFCPNMHGGLILTFSGCFHR
jgi:hypothetical protein